MAYGTGTQTAVVGAPGEVHTSAKNTVGTTATFSDGNEYMYLPGVASTIAGSWVTINPAGGTFATALLTKTAVGPVAIATAATDASTEYGWYLVRGYYSGAAAGSDGTIVSAAGSLAGTSASAGQVVVFTAATSAAVAGAELIHGAFSYSAQPDSDSAASGTPGADQIVVYINYPFVHPAQTSAA